MKFLKIFILVVATTAICPMFTVDAQSQLYAQNAPQGRTVTAYYFDGNFQSITIQISSSQVLSYWDGYRWQPLGNVSIYKGRPSFACSDQSMNGWFQMQDFNASARIGSLTVYFKM